MKLLIVEDDIGLHKQYKWSIDGFELLFAKNRQEAIDIINTKFPELILLDLGLPPDEDNASEGLLVLSEVTSSGYGAKVIVITGSEQREHSLSAIDLGAFDFLQKGVPKDELNNSINRAAKYYQVEQENKTLKQYPDTDLPLIGKSHSMSVATKKLIKVAPMPISTLLLGESGTGKEVFARTLHDLSEKKGSFIALNCASIPNDLLESELFGHEKGAFTGAHRQKKGKVESAHGGTLFLDEIGDMPLELQVKMLRFLQEREIERVGSSVSIAVDVRIVCATHRNLKDMISLGLFREDLYFRLAEFTIEVPALRERGMDILLLADYWFDIYKKALSLTDSGPTGFSLDAKSSMLAYGWPGNVRELQNKVRTALVICESDLITTDALDIPSDSCEFKINIEGKNITDVLPMDDVRNNAKDAAERTALSNAIKKTDGNIAAAAKLLKITRPTFYSLADKHKLSCRRTT
jgi:two-component system NtrC family response regulator